MFLLNLKTIEVKCLKVDVRDEAWRWHMRFGHLNFGALKLLGDKYMVKRMPLINHQHHLCEACLLGKHFKEEFSKKNHDKSNQATSTCSY